MTHQSEDRLPLDPGRVRASRFLAAFLIFFLLAGSPGGAHTIARTGEEEEIRSLEPGKSVRREIFGEQKQGYQIRLRAGQFLKVTAEQEGIDVVVVMIEPEGKRITEFDSESRSHGQETVTRVAERDGDFLLLVQPRQRNAPAGYYQIRIDELRAATESDRALQEARLLCQECLEKQVMGPPAGTLTAIERALEIRERVLGPDHPEVAAALNGLGRIYRSKGDFATAETLFHRALDILEKTFGSDNPALADSLNNLGHLYRNQADYAKAEAMFQRSLAILQSSLGPEHPNYAFALHNLGLLNWSKGNYAKAEQFFLRALDIWKRALNPENPQLALAHFGLGNFYNYRGEYPRAEAFYREALSIWEKALGMEHPDVARTLNSLAIVYREEGNFEKAEPLADRALGILEKVAGPNNPEVGRTLNNLALISHGCGDQRKAEQWANRSLDILEKTLGLENPDVAASLNTLALIKRAGGDYAGAEQLFQRSLAISVKALGPKHPYVAEVLDELAMLHATMGDTARAVAYQAHADEISEANLALNLEVGTERQKQSYQAMLAKQTDRTLTLHLRYAPHDPAARNLAATIILQRKGRELDETSQSLGALRSRSDGQDRALFDRLSEVRSRIAALILGEPRISTGQYREGIGKLEETAGKLEFEISSRSSEFRSNSRRITLEAVQAAIPAGTALIEFVTYRPFKAGPTGEGGLYEQPHYVAYVLRREGEIRWKELGEASQIDKAVESLRKALRDPLREDVMGLARDVYARVFQPVQQFLPGMTRLLISPDGSLNLVPFEALLDQRGRYLVQRYSISYLTSGRDLLRLQIPRESKSGPLIVADPDFGRRSLGTLAQLAQGKGAELGNQEQRNRAGSAFSEYYFRPLPYSAQEGETLRELLPGATLLTRREATKAALSQVRSPSLLHIATHGFFLESPHLTDSELRGPEKPDLQLLKPEEISIENPLLRSGLALAGANEQKKDDNGIMTALEMTGLNLWGTRLVVLSACDTGIGEVKVGDGVHGLRRALVLAGAESQVMSLWAVSDKATRDLMIRYYRLLKQGEGRGDALRKVQLEMLKSVNRRHPHYWACFIQSGEWANLAGRR